MRILIADDNEAVRQGVVGLLAKRVDWNVCGEAKNGAEAIEMARELLPDLVLLDVSMPDVNGLEALPRILQAAPHSKIIVMSQYDPARLLASAIRAGAQTCIDKSRLGMDLVPAIVRATGSDEVAHH
jgi:DNA-binding NarL/FixJ family response regulator